MERDRKVRSSPTELGKPTELATRLESTRPESAEVERLLRELAAHQVELEMQADELRRTQEELTASRNRYRKLYELAPVGYLTVDGSGRIIQANSMMASLLGIERDQLPGRPFAGLVEEHSADGFLQAVRRLQRGSSREPCDVVLKARADGSQQTLAHVSCLTADEGASAEAEYLVAVTDVSDLRTAQETRTARLQAQLNQARKLEALGTLASGVAHDFSNLLMGIGGCAQIALDASPAESPARLYLAEIMKSAASGASISKRLLLFSRTGSTASCVFELNSVVAGTERLLARLLREDIDLVVRLGSKDSRVQSDPGQIEQLLLNLAVNARDAMPRGGTLTVETRDVEGSDGSPGSAVQHVALAVSDTGLGMSEATRRRIFEPFFTTKEIGRGTGLGLSTVHGIVQQAGGHIRVESRINVGTTFEVLLPRANQPISSTMAYREEDTSPNEKGDGTILLVEDEQAVRMGLRYYLERAGYRVLEATNGSEALECCARYSGPIDLLLTDVVLPRGGGAEIAEEMRKLKPGVRALFMSAHAPEWLEREGRLPPGVRLLQKPFGAELLLLRVHQALATARAEAAVTRGAVQRRPRAPGGMLLLVEDERVARLAIAEYFRNNGWGVLEAGDGEEALELCRGCAGEITSLLIDYFLPTTRGDQLARDLEALCPKASVVYMSAYPDLASELPGALLSKPLDLEAVFQTVTRGAGASRDG